MTQPRVALIAGAGPAGLACALACARAGWKPKVYERRDSDAQAFGIQLPPVGVRACDALGLGEALRRVASAPKRLEIRTSRGKVITTLRLPDTHLVLARADLTRLLREALEARAPAAIRYGESVAEIHAQALTLANGERVEGALAVNALGARDTAKAMPYTAHRAMPRIALDRPTLWLGSRRHMVAYPVGAWVNVVAIAPQAMAPEEAFARFDPLAQALLRAAPLTPWRLWQGSRRRAGPLAVGDALLAMPPSLALGAAKALEDASQLETLLSGASSETPQLARFARRRARRAGKLARASSWAWRFVHLREPWATPAHWGLRLWHSMGATPFRRTHRAMTP